jgi:hypothetical protein
MALIWTPQDWRNQPPEGTKPRALAGLGKPIFLHYGRTPEDQSGAGIFTRTSVTFGDVTQTQAGPGPRSVVAEFDAGSTFLPNSGVMTAIGVARLESLRAVGENLLIVSSLSDFSDGFLSVSLGSTELLNASAKSVGQTQRNATAARTYAAGQIISFCAVWRGGLFRGIWLDTGQSATSTASGSSAPRYLRLGATTANISQQLIAVYPTAVSDDQAAELARAPWASVFEPRRIWVPVDAGGGVTGTSATTNAADTSSASGTTTVTGTSATTNAADTSNAAGTTTVTGTLATTNADDTAAASGAVGGDITGSSATTNANDASAASGTTTIVGASATTNADDASNAAGTTTIVGSSATTNADDTAAASGVAGAITGTSATTNADDTASAEGYPGDEPPAVAVVKRGGGSNFVKARKRLAVEYLIEYLTEEEPSAETKRVIAEIKAGRPVPADAKPPSAARSLSVADLAEKIIPRRLMSYQNLIVDAIEPQRVIARAVRIAEEREDEDLLMLL